MPYNKIPSTFSAQGHISATPRANKEPEATTEQLAADTATGGKHVSRGARTRRMCEDAATGETHPTAETAPGAEQQADDIQTGDLLATDLLSDDIQTDDLLSDDIQTDDLQAAASEARALFPRGLEQPAGSFRFSIDALLLASFARAGATRTFADLGTGCGVVGLALCLLHQRLTGYGIEIGDDLAAAANRNAMRLGLAERFKVLHGDLGNQTHSPALFVAHPCEDAESQGEAAEPQAQGDVTATATTEVLTHSPSDTASSCPGTPSSCHGAPLAVLPWPELTGTCDLVTANPPYRVPGTGRPAATEARNRALFETHGTLETFTTAAARLLRHGGRLCVIYGAARLPDLLATLRAACLEPKRLRLVHSRVSASATLVLVEAQRGARPELVIEPPLVLYSGNGAATALTPEALAFCPFLGCNAAPRGAEKQKR